MTSRPLVPAVFSDRTYPPLGLDQIDLFFDTTMGGGTALIAPASTNQLGEYMLISANVIMEYERTIADLRRELLHYKRLVSQMVGPAGRREDYDSQRAVIPLDSASAQIVNSIVRAEIPQLAAFREFDEEEW